MSAVRSGSNEESQEEKLLEPIRYLMRVPGKSVRKKLMQAFNVWTGVSDDKVAEIGSIIDMLHNASLLLDDIEDNSNLRRGIPVAHKIYGVPSTLNCASYVMFIGLEKVIDLGHPMAVKTYSEQMLELHRGQGMEIYWRDNYTCPSEDDYRQMTVRKTGGLFNLAVRLMLLFSDQKTDGYIKLTTLLGLYFQIRDDYANLRLDEYAANKSFAEDLTEGKFSFPIIHAIRSRPDDNQIMKILRQRTDDVEVKKYCVSLLQEFGSFDYTLKVMRGLDGEVRDEIEKLGGNPLLVRLMDELKNWDR